MSEILAANGMGSWGMLVLTETGNQAKWLLGQKLAFSGLETSLNFKIIFHGKKPA